MPHELNVPPHNLDAERSVLGSMLLVDAAIDEATSRLEADDFYSTAHQWIFSAIESIRAAGITVDAVTVAEKLQVDGKLEEVGGPMLLNEILETVPHAAHVEHYAGIVKEKAIRRRVLAAAYQAINSVHDEGTPLDELLSDTEQGVHGCIEEMAGDGPVDIGQALIAAWQHIDSGEPFGWVTGYPDLDNTIIGWQPGSLVILGARPSVGKTAFALNCTLHSVEAGHNVLFMSLEQSQLEIAERLLSMHSGISCHRIREHDLSTQDTETLLSASNQMHDMKYWIDDRAALSVSQISAVARIWKRKHDLKILFVDYLQLIRPENRRIQRYEQVAEITRSLKTMARQLNICIVCLCQLSRQIELRAVKKPILSDLRESGNIEQDADMVLFIDRPSTYDESANPAVAKLYVAKNRNGKTGTVDLIWQPDTMRFESAAQPWQQEAGAGFVPQEAF